MSAGPAPIIALRDASKSYGAVRAVRDTSIALHAGEVRALVGENGAGKSTIVRLLAGVTLPDTGSVLVDGEPVDFHGPADARDAGIAVIYQEPTVFPDLSVAENVMMGRQPLSTARRIDRGALHEQVQGLLDRLGVRLDARQPVRGLSIADQQIVEIAKALSFDARVLIMDEPTAALSGPEVERLFAVVRSLQEAGAAVLFISHRLDEVFAICNTVTVMRDGAVVHDASVGDMTTDEMVRRMVGRELGALYPKQAAQVGERVLEVKRLTREGVFFDVSFEVRAGEIVALAGLVGAGRTEVARAIFGIDRTDAGHVRGLRSAAGAGPAARGHARGHRVRARGPPHAGPGDGPVGRAQRNADADAGPQPPRADPRRRRESPGARLGAAAAAEVPPARGPGRLPLRRQPAEGRARQVAGDRAEAADPRRADARHRRRHQGRGAPADERARRPTGSPCS